jgi:hypothetical protein
MCANTSPERMCAERSRRLRSLHAGSIEWNVPGVRASPYQPTPNPSPFVVSAPIVECRLWSMSECFGSLFGMIGMVLAAPLNLALGGDPHRQGADGGEGGRGRGQ